MPQFQCHPTLNRSPYHLPELDPLYDPHTPMSGKQNSEELWGVCAFRLVGSFAFALSLPFAALCAAFSVCSPSFNFCSLSSFISGLSLITRAAVRFLQFARGACLSALRRRIFCFSVQAFRRYREFISLGPGGTPPNIFGYAKIVFFQVFKPSLPGPNSVTGIGYLPALKPRLRLPPTVAGIAPQRQTTQKAGQDVQNMLWERLRA